MKDAIVHLITLSGILILSTILTILVTHVTVAIWDVEILAIPIGIIMFFFFKWHLPNFLRIDKKYL